MKPTLRENYRYIAIEIDSEAPLKREDLTEILQNESMVLLGVIRYPKVMPKVVYFDQIKQRAIVRCLNEGTEDLKTALALLNKWKGGRVHLRAFFTSGTIKKAKERI